MALFFILWGCHDNSCRLNVSFSLAEDEWGYLRQEIFPVFEQQYKCKISPIQLDAQSLAKLLWAQKLSGRSDLDLFAQDNMQLSLLVKKGLVADLTAMDVSSLIPSMLSVGEFEGRRLFIPFRPNVQIFYYNKKIFEKYNLSPPADWQQLLSVARFFHQQEKVGRVLLKGYGGAVTVTQLYEMFISAGADPFDFNDPAFISTFRYLKDLWRYLSPESKKAKWDNSNDYLASDTVYLMQNWPFGYKVLTEKYQKNDVGVYVGPKGPAGLARVIGGDVFGVPIASKNKELAVKFIQYMISQAVQKKLVGDLNWPSVRDDAYPVHSSELLQVIRQAIKHGVYRPNVFYWPQYQKLFEELFLEIIYQDKDIEVALRRAQAKLDKIIGKAK